MTQQAQIRRPVPEAAISAVQRKGSHKRDLVRIVLREAVARGQVLSKAAVHRRAGVSRDLVDAMQAEYDAAMAQVKRDLTGGAEAGAEMTTASLRAQVVHYRELHQRAEKQVAALERRLGILLGQQLTSEPGAAAASMLLADENLQRRIAELEGEVGDLSSRLSGTQEELDRVRKVNVRLMRQKNITPRPENEG